MAKTLKEFLEVRARHDYRCARLFLNNLLKPNQLTMVLKETAIGVVQGDLGKLPTNLSLPRNTILEASSVGANLAGEAAKRIEIETPEVLDMMPDFPWRALKKLRDRSTHFYRDGGIDSNTPAASEFHALMEEVMAYLNDHQQLTDIETLKAAEAINPHVRSMIYGVSLFSAFFQIAKAHSGETAVDVVQSQAAKEVESLTLVPPHYLPSLVIGMFLRTRMNLTLDTIDSTSSFFRETHKTLYRSPKLEILREHRNSRAHFDDVLVKQGGLNDGIMLDGLACSQLIDQIGNTFKLKPPSSTDHTAVETYISKLTVDYSKTVLGNAGMSPDKVTTMDKWVAWLDKSLAVKKTVRRKTEEACVTAVGTLLQRTPLANAEDVLGFVRKHREALADPQRLITEAAGESKALQSGIRIFVDQMQRVLAPSSSKRAA